MFVPAVPLRGAIWLDDGAVRAVRDHKKSLFPVGVIKVVGDFSAQVRERCCF
jgi:glutamate 5-kinase